MSIAPGLLRFIEINIHNKASHKLIEILHFQHFFKKGKMQNVVIGVRLSEYNISKTEIPLSPLFPMYCGIC